MPALFSDIRSRVQSLIRQRDAKATSVSVIDVDEAICHEFIALRAQVPAARLYTASALTLSNTDGTFSLPAAGAQYAGELRIQLASNGQFLQECTVEELDAYRRGQVAVTQGVPYHYCVWREKDQTVQGRCWPPPTGALACHLFRSLDAEDLRDTDLDSVSTNLSRKGETALVHRCAAMLVESMLPEDLKLRRLNPAVVATWRKTAAVLLYKEACETWDLEGVGRIQRWVS